MKMYKFGKPIVIIVEDMGIIQHDFKNQLEDNFYVIQIYKLEKAKAIFKSLVNEGYAHEENGVKLQLFLEDIDYILMDGYLNGGETDCTLELATWLRANPRLCGVMIAISTTINEVLCSDTACHKACEKSNGPTMVKDLYSASVQ